MGEKSLFEGKNEMQWAHTLWNPKRYKVTFWAVHSTIDPMPTIWLFLNQKILNNCSRINFEVFIFEAKNFNWKTALLLLSAHS